VKTYEFHNDVNNQDLSFQVGYNGGMKTYTRREFLKMQGLAMSGMVLNSARNPLLTGKESIGEKTVGRVTIASVSVYSKPWDKSPILYQRFRDEIINLYDSVESSYGPDYNPRWYRVWRGYVHSARIQIVKTRLNPIADKLPEAGQIGEITVPVAFPLHYDLKDKWTRIYPLYYASVHWITDIIEGPDQTSWYQITEAWSKDKFYVPAEMVRLIPSEELSPLSPEIPPEKKWIDISISRQTLIAYEDGKEVLNTLVSTGLGKEVPGQLPWRTPIGEHHVMSKMPSQHMGDDPITSDVSGYVLPGVPWVSYFHESGVALHGTYWHDNFGVPMSHGCVNMRPEDAKWIFRWTTPAPVADKREIRGLGTVVLVH
jgi:lipoprotein-anchoring transpeptidase ErfK/SrfK